MLRFPELILEAQSTNTGPRITIDEALSDPDWGEFLDVGSGAKRVRLDEDDNNEVQS